MSRNTHLLYSKNATRYVGCSPDVTISCIQNSTEALFSGVTQAFLLVSKLTVRDCPKGALWFVAQCLLLNHISVINSGVSSGYVRGHQ